MIIHDKSKNPVIFNEVCQCVGNIQLDRQDLIFYLLTLIVTSPFTTVTRSNILTLDVLNVINRKHFTLLFFQNNYGKKFFL